MIIDRNNDRRVLAITLILLPASTRAWLTDASHRERSYSDTIKAYLMQMRRHCGRRGRNNG